MRRAPAPIGAAYRDMLIPADDHAAERIAKLPIGEDVAVQVKRGRSLPQMKLYWAVLQFVAEASEWETAERLHVALKVRLGLYDAVKLPSGKLVPVVQSAAFDSMTHEVFTDYMDKALALICSEVIPGMTSDRLIAEAQSALGIRPSPGEAA